MTYLDLILFILISIGITNIIVTGSIFESVRERINSKSEFLGILVTCSTCTGFWVGALLYFTDYFALPWLFCAAISSVVNQVFAIVVDYLSAKTYQALDNNEGENNE